MKTICGVDVSAERLDARVGLQGAYAIFPRDEAGVAALAAFCRKHQVDLVAMEASGGYEKLPLALLAMHGIGCALVNPRAVRDVARGLGLLEKTDRIDAGVIAHFAKVCEARPQPVQEADHKRLRALVNRLRQLTALDVEQRHQARLVDDPIVLAGIDEMRKVIAAQVKTLEREIASAIDDHPVWSALNAAFRQIKGVALRTVAHVVAYAPLIGTIGNKAISKFVGLAPLADDSGRRAGRRSIAGGRAEVRDILYMVAHCVRMHNEEFKAFDARLRAAGKPPKVIRTALAHKLIVQLNAKARDARKEMGYAT